MFVKNGNKRGAVAFDAAGASGMAYLSSQLEKISTDLVKPLASVTHQRDITIETGGGFVEFLSSFASDYGSTGSNQYGLQGTSNTDIPQIQVNVTKGIWYAFNWASTLLVTYIDLKRLEAAQSSGQPAPFSLNDLLDSGCKLVYNKALDRVTYLGWLGQPGLINNPAVTSATVSGGTWASKTPIQIQTDVNNSLYNALSASGYSLEGMPDTMLIPWSRYNTLQQPMTTGGFSSVLEFILQNNIARENGVDFKIFPLPDPWIATAGASGSARALTYVNKKQSVKLQIPQPINKAMMVPSVQAGGAYETLFNACIGQVQWLRPQTAYYSDGI